MLVGKGTVGKYVATTDEINRFLTDVRRYSVPTPEEEEALVRRYKEQNDDSARQELIERNLRLIYSIAKVYARNESEVLDYVNEGVEGFNEAFKKFDLTRGIRFITYAAYFLRRQMGMYMNTTRNIIRKSNNIKLSKPIEKIKQKVFSETGMNPADDIIVELLQSDYGIAVKDYSDICDLVITSINEEVDEDYTIEDTADFCAVTASVNEYEEEIEQAHVSSAVNEILSSIPEKQQTIIRELFGIGCDPKTVDQIACEMDCDVVIVEKMRDKTFKYIKQNFARMRISL